MEIDLKKKDSLIKALTNELFEHKNRNSWLGS